MKNALSFGCVDVDSLLPLDWSREVSVLRKGLPRFVTEGRIDASIRRAFMGDALFVQRSKTITKSLHFCAALRLARERSKQVIGQWKIVDGVGARQQKKTRADKTWGPGSRRSAGNTEIA